jgi:hypothetical protein
MPLSRNGAAHSSIFLPVRVDRRLAWTQSTNRSLFAAHSPARKSVTAVSIWPGLNDLCRLLCHVAYLVVERRRT